MDINDLANYSVKKTLGAGGMATVYLCISKKIHKNVAIKVLNPEFINNSNIRSRFIAEAKRMAILNHKNIVQVFDLIDENDFSAIVMEYVDGVTLKEHLDKNAKFKNEEINSVFFQILDAVGYVHSMKFVHRDIKPSNLMIDERGIVKLMDFGISKDIDPNSLDYTKTEHNQIMGTPLYMSPEQIKESRNVTEQSDIYSLGVLLWQLVSGKRPYDPNLQSQFEIQSSIVNLPLPFLNSPYDSVIKKATEKNVINRFDNCLTFKNSLQVISIGTNSESDATIFDNTNSVQPKVRIAAKSPVRATSETSTTELVSSKRGFVLICIGVAVFSFILYISQSQNSSYETEAPPAEENTEEMPIEEEVPVEESAPVADPAAAPNSPGSPYLGDKCDNCGYVQNIDCTNCTFECSSCGSSNFSCISKYTGEWGIPGRYVGDGDCDCTNCADEN